MAGYLKDYKRIATEKYRDHSIEVVFYGPDYGLQVNGETIGGFFVNTKAALSAAHRYIDELEKEKKKS